MKNIRIYLQLTVVVFLISCAGESYIDDDGDGVGNYDDNCPMIANTDQSDLDKNGLGDKCESFDFDGDFISDDLDNCKDKKNPDQADFNDNQRGDACEDSDNDFVLDIDDNCKVVPNSKQDTIDQCQRLEKMNLIFVLIRGGSFLLGNEFSEEDEKPLNTIELNDFFISKAEITVKQYQACIAAKACSWSKINTNQELCNQNKSGKENHPINCLTWYQSQQFAQWVGGRLPSEAQWEYTARSAGQIILFPWGNKPVSCDLVNYKSCEKNGTTKICQYPLGNTAQGVCDMSGNLWEWIQDEYHPNYVNIPTNGDPWCEGNCSSSENRVIRGGCWNNESTYLKTTYRNAGDPHHAYDYIGFRLVIMRED